LTTSQFNQPAKPEAPQPSTLFTTLCQDVLGVQRAGLLPAGTLAALAGPALLFPAGSEIDLPPAGLWITAFTRQDHYLPAADIGAGAAMDWAVPLWSSRGLDGVLFLKENHSHNPLTEEEMEIAQAAGERLLDLLAGAEMARLAMELLGQQLARTHVMEGQGRRVLHDEVLPNLHTALLYLNDTPTSPDEKRQTMQALTDAHRRISDLMREMPMPLPHRLAQNGLGAALKTLVEVDFANQFSQTHLYIHPEAAQKAREMPSYIAEALFFACRELIRNAAVHGRGGQVERSLALAVHMQWQDELCLVIEDDGVGPQDTGNKVETGPLKKTGNSGSGLRIHSAILAAVGARLDISARPEGGTRAMIRIRPGASNQS
jgi:signal transduction histidine kinase